MMSGSLYGAFELEADQNEEMALDEINQLYNQLLYQASRFLVPEVLGFATMISHIFGQRIKTGEWNGKGVPCPRGTKRGDWIKLRTVCTIIWKLR